MQTMWFMRADIKSDVKVVLRRDKDEAIGH